MNINKKIVLSVLLLVTGGIGYHVYFNVDTQAVAQQSLSNQFDIRPFDPEKHTQFIKQQNYDNWYLLHNSPDYNLDFMLEKSSPYDWEPKTYGTLKTVVLYDNNQPAGFVNFYMRGLREGTVFLLSVDTKQRGKGYGEALLRYAVEGLKQQGAQYIKLSVRAENEPAQKLYRKLGFAIESSDHGFHFYRLAVTQ